MTADMVREISASVESRSDMANGFLHPIKQGRVSGTEPGEKKLCQESAPRRCSRKASLPGSQSRMRTEQRKTGASPSTAKTR